MTKLGGAWNIADTTSPDQTDTTLMIVEMSIAMLGPVVSMIAVAAGVTTKAKRSNVPTAWTAMVTASPSSAMNDRQRPHRNAFGLGDLGIGRREQHRTVDKTDAYSQKHQ